MLGLVFKLDTFFLFYRIHINLDESLKINSEQSSNEKSPRVLYRLELAEFLASPTNNSDSVSKMRYCREIVVVVVVKPH